MLRKDLDKLFTEKVSEYVSKGLTIHTCTMGGSQGETAKVDLTDGKNVYRIYMDDEHEKIDGEYFDTIHIYIGVDKTVKPYAGFDIVWNSKLSLIEDLRYFVFDNYVTDSIEEAKIISNKKTERLASHNPGVTYFEIPVNKTSKKIVLNKLNSLKGFKSIKTINRIVKLKSNWDSNYRYMVECKTPNGEIKRINLW